MSELVMSQGFNADSFAIPEGACDCHTHVFLDQARFPFSPDRKYTPPPASCEDLKSLLGSLGLDRVVIVQPSVYGADNSATLAGLGEIGLDRARGVAVIDAEVSRAEMNRLMDAGVRGIRVNFELKGEADERRAARQLETMAAKIAPYGWHIQIYAQLRLLATLLDTLRGLPVPLVFDHFAGARGEQGLDQPGLAGVIDLVREGRAYVKLSAAYRSSHRQPDYADLAPIARAFINANPDRVVWGSDWPHPDPTLPPNDVSAPLPVDDSGVFSLLAQWTNDERAYRKVLQENPARLYGF
jgi:predicted TIM-barrel fold metal-dependent hydrolase